MLYFLETWAGPIKEVILIIVAIVGAVVAVYGLNTWRKQLGGTAKYELARRLLREVYQFREALQFVRFPIISAKEMELSEEDFREPVNYKEKRNFELAKAYQNRYQKVIAARSAIDATLMEVEVLWGTPLPSKVRKLYKWDGELYGTILEHLDATTTDAADGGRTPVDKIKNMKTLYASGDRNKDEFLKDLQNDIKEIEKDVQSLLKTFV